MKKLKKKIDVTFEKSATGYSAYADHLNVYTTGDNIETLTGNLVEALNLYYEDVNCFVDHTNLRLKFDISQFFKMYKVLNARFVAGRIGMSPSLLSEYVSGKRTPSAKQTKRIVLGINSIGKELSSLAFY